MLQPTSRQSGLSHLSRLTRALPLTGILARRWRCGQRMQIAEPDQINIVASAVPCDLQQIGHARKAGLAGKLRCDLRKIDGLHGFDFDLAFVHTVVGPGPHMRTSPYPNAAGNLSPTDSFAKTLCEDHAESLHPAPLSRAPPPTRLPRLWVPVADHRMQITRLEVPIVPVSFVKPMLPIIHGDLNPYFFL